MKLKKLYIISAIFYGIPFLVWILTFWYYKSYPLSFKTGDWSNFGGFLGGVLGPLFTMLGFYVIGKTISQSENNHNEQMHLLKQQNSIDHLMRLIDIYNEKLEGRVSDFTQLFGNEFGKNKVDNKWINLINESDNLVTMLSKFEYNKSHSYCLKEKDDALFSLSVKMAGMISVDAELTLIRILEHVLKQDKDEAENFLDLIESSMSFYGTRSLVYFSLTEIILDKANDPSLVVNSPLFERLKDINDISDKGYIPELTDKYLKLKSI
ncbi:hypothetical protein D3C73_746170 [compost metagenome]